MKSLYRRIRANLKVVQRFVADRGVRGDSPTIALFIRLPGALTRRGYAKLAHIINGRVLNSPLNGRRLHRLLSDHISDSGGHFFLIVMPGTLHFILPCLSLVPKHIAVVLLANGATRWERQKIKQYFPQHKMLTLHTLPSSSLSHGDVITLLLKHNRVPFGILDHDLYIFDESVYDQLHLDPGEFALTLFWERGPLSGIPFAHTFFLYFSPQHLRQVMRRFRIDARIYRNAPYRLTEPLQQLGFTKGRFPKDYLNYYDTLQLLFAAAQTTGLQWRPIAGNEKHRSVHVGGTSFSAHGTKDASQLYIYLKFLEICDPDIKQHYFSTVAPFHSASQLRPRLCKSTQGNRFVESVDRLIDSLKEVGATTSPVVDAD